MKAKRRFEAQLMRMMSNQLQYSLNVTILPVGGPRAKRPLPPEENGQLLFCKDNKRWILPGKPPSPTYEKWVVVWMLFHDHYLFSFFFCFVSDVAGEN